MILLRHLSRFPLGSSNLDPDDNRVAWSRAQIAFEITFSLIEAAVILGALGAAWDASPSASLTIIWGVAYFAMGVYILTGSNYFVALFFEHHQLIERFSISPFVFRIVTSAMALMVPYIVSGLASDAIVQALK